MGTNSAGKPKPLIRQQAVAGKEGNYTTVAVPQSPGNFILFWNVVIPMSVILNVLCFGVRDFELFLFLGLLINPYILEFIMKSHALSWVVVVYLIILVQKILKNWPSYEIYTGTFLINLLLFFVFLAIPDMVIKYMWNHLCVFLYNAIKSADATLTQDQIAMYRNSILLVGALIILLHSVYIYSVYSGLTVCFKGSFELKRRYDPCPPDCQPVRQEQCSWSRTACDCFMDTVIEILCDYI